MLKMTNPHPFQRPTEESMQHSDDFENEIPEKLSPCKRINNQDIAPVPKKKRDSDVPKRHNSLMNTYCICPLCNCRFPSVKSLSSHKEDCIKCNGGEYSVSAWKSFKKLRSSKKSLRKSLLRCNEDSILISDSSDNSDLDDCLIVDEFPTNSSPDANQNGQDSFIVTSSEDENDCVIVEEFHTTVKPDAEIVEEFHTTVKPDAEIVDVNRKDKESSTVTCREEESDCLVVHESPNTCSNDAEIVEANQNDKEIFSVASRDDVVCNKQDVVSEPKEVVCSGSENLVNTQPVCKSPMKVIELISIVRKPVNLEVRCKLKRPVTIKLQRILNPLKNVIKKRKFRNLESKQDKTNNLESQVSVHSAVTSKTDGETQNNKDFVKESNLETTIENNDDLSLTGRNSCDDYQRVHDISENNVPKEVQKKLGSHAIVNHVVTSHDSDGTIVKKQNIIDERNKVVVTVNRKGLNTSSADPLIGCNAVSDVSSASKEVQKKVESNVYPVVALKLLDDKTLNKQNVVKDLNKVVGYNSHARLTQPVCNSTVKVIEDPKSILRKPVNGELNNVVKRLANVKPKSILKTTRHSTKNCKFVRFNLVEKTEEKIQSKRRSHGSVHPVVTSQPSNGKPKKKKVAIEEPNKVSNLTEKDTSDSFKKFNDMELSEKDKTFSEEVQKKLESHPFVRPIHMLSHSHVETMKNHDVIKGHNKFVAFVQKEVSNTSRIDTSDDSDDFEGFDDISYRGPILPKEQIQKEIRSNVIVSRVVSPAKDSDSGTIKQQCVIDEPNKVVANVCNKICVSESGSDSSDDFNGFYDVDDEDQTVKKIKCSYSAIVPQRSNKLSNIKYSTANKEQSQKTECSSSELVEQRSVDLSNIQNSTSNEEKSMKTDCSYSNLKYKNKLRHSKRFSKTDSPTITPKTKLYSVKHGIYKCIYCEVEKSSISSMRRHLQNCTDAPLTIIKSIKHSTIENSPIIDEETRLEKNTINGKTRLDKNLDASFSPFKALKLDSNLIRGKMLELGSKYGGKRHYEDLKIARRVANHFYRASYSSADTLSELEKKTLLDYYDKTDDNISKVDKNGQGWTRMFENKLPNEQHEENNNRLNSDSPNNKTNSVAILQPVTSTEFKDRCPHCSEIICGFNNYSKHLLMHRLKPVSMDSTSYLPEYKLINKNISPNTNQPSNWKKAIIEDYLFSGNERSASSSGYSSPITHDNVIDCNEPRNESYVAKKGSISNELESSPESGKSSIKADEKLRSASVSGYSSHLTHDNVIDCNEPRNESYVAKKGSISNELESSPESGKSSIKADGKLVRLDSLDPLSDIDFNNIHSNHQIKVPNPNKDGAVIEIKKHSSADDDDLSDDIQEQGVVCAICDRLFKNNEALVSHLYSSHLKVGTPLIKKFNNKAAKNTNSNVQNSTDITPERNVIRNNNYHQVKVENCPDKQIENHCAIDRVESSYVTDDTYLKNKNVEKEINLTPALSTDGISNKQIKCLSTIHQFHDAFNDDTKRCVETTVKETKIDERPETETSVMPAESTSMSPHSKEFCKQCQQPFATRSELMGHECITSVQNDISDSTLKTNVPSTIREKFDDQLQSSTIPLMSVLYFENQNILRRALKTNVDGKNCINQQNIVNSIPSDCLSLCIICGVKYRRLEELVQHREKVHSQLSNKAS